MLETLKASSTPVGQSLLDREPSAIDNQQGTQQCSPETTRISSWERTQLDGIVQHSRKLAVSILKLEDDKVFAAFKPSNMVSSDLVNAGQVNAITTGSTGLGPTEAAACFANVEQFDSLELSN